MSHLEVPRFPRGFLLADRPVEAPPKFVPGPLLENFWIHPWAEVEAAGNAELFVIVLGHCVSTTPVKDESPAAVLLEALRSSQDEFFRVISRYSGRHAVIFGSQRAPKIVNDATGMRTVFYAGSGGIVASHAALVETALGADFDKDELPFQYGYPGNRTPYLRTKLLTPNTYYDATANAVHRFWPKHKPVERSVEYAAATCLEAATNAFRNMAQGRTVNMALTAGVDSRVIFAVGLKSGTPFKTYTYGAGKDTLRDRLFAADLAERYDVSHEVIPRLQNSEELNASLDEANYARHHKPHVAALTAWYDDPEAVAVSGNLMEIGRSFYQGRRESGADAPTTAPAMSRLHSGTMGAKIRNSIEEYGRERFEDVSILAFQSYIEDSELSTAISNLDPFDQFYWEHRMAAWHGVSMNERDFYGIAFIPFNSRHIFEAMLGVPVMDRDQASVFYRMIELVDPSLLNLPINPKQWPPAARPS